MVGLGKERFIEELRVLNTQEKSKLQPISSFSMPRVSDIVLRVNISYTDYIKRRVW